MLQEGKEQARRIIAEARKIRCSADFSSALGSTAASASHRFIRTFDELLELAESLLAEQETYESRLHRSHTPAPDLPLPNVHHQ